MEKEEDNARRKKARKIFLVFLITLLVIGILLLSFWKYGSPAPISVSTVPMLPTFSGGIGVFKAPNGDAIGISDGSSIFDVSNDRVDRTLKQQGAEYLNTRDVSSAIALWNSARAQDTSDAEAAIYLEDQRVLASGRPYITLVVATTFQQSTPDYTSREILQGAYVAQKEANDGCKLVQCSQVRLLIANSGSVATYATTIAQQIVQVAKSDKTLLGVIGWSSSPQTLNAIRVLASAHIPLVSPSASSDALTGISPYFFRIVPPSAQEGSLAAGYATQQLRARRAALFVDSTDVSSQSLAQDFTKAFTARGGSLAVSENYQTGKVGNFKSLIQDALTHKPDLVYFPGNVGDVQQFLADLPSLGPSAQVPVMGSTAFSIPVRSLTKQYPNFGRLYFTAFAFADQWSYAGLGAEQPIFFDEYAQAFDPNGQHPQGQYDYSRPGTFAMVSYDATDTLLHATQTALQARSNPTPDAIVQNLAKINGSQAIQGVTGQISFGADHNPVDKAIVVLRFDSQNYLKIQSVSGCFLTNCPK